MYFVAALIPMIMGMIYYHPKVAGTAWMKANGFEPKDLEGGNMAAIMIVSYILSVFLAFGLTGVVIHQFMAFGMFAPEIFEAGSEAQATFTKLMEDYGSNGRTFGHGALHGAMAGITILLPVFGANSLFEKRGWNYILVNVIYWTITVALMGGLLCATLRWDAL